jgi:hypothetical protein
VAMGKYVKRADVVIHAMKLKYRTAIFVDGDDKPPRIAEPGDFLVDGVLGQQYPVSEAVFLSTYQPADEAK